MASTDELYQHFTASTAGNSRAQRELRRLLSSVDKLPEQQSTLSLLPIDEMELRLQYIGHIEDYWRKNFTRLTKCPQNQYRALNDFEISGLLQMDLNFLRLCAENELTLNASLEAVHKLPAALKIFATKKLSDKEITIIEAANDSAAEPELEPELISESSASETTAKRRKTKFQANGKAKRNDFYTEKRQKLDQYRCVITGTSNPKICPIIPFAVNSTEQARGRWENGICSITELQIVETLTNQSNLALGARLRSLFSSGVGVSDRYWNTIPLSPTLYDWWGKGYFGLKCLGTRGVDSGDADQIMALRIQFHWMVWREREIGQKPAIPLGRTTESIQAAFRPHCGHHSPSNGRPIVAISQPATGFNVESGDVFEVLVPKRHVQKMFMAFNLQWALIKLLAIAGGAEALDDVPDHPEFLDEFWKFPGNTAVMREFQALNEAMEAEDRRAAAANSESSEDEQDTGEGPSRQRTEYHSDLDAPSSSERKEDVKGKSIAGSSPKQAVVPPKYAETEAIAMYPKIEGDGGLDKDTRKRDRVRGWGKSFINRTARALKLGLSTKALTKQEERESMGHMMDRPSRLTRSKLQGNTFENPQND